MNQRSYYYWPFNRLSSSNYILRSSTFCLISVTFTSPSQLRVLAFDDLYPEQTSTATVEINVLRNQNRPSWTNQVPIRVTINETEPLGYLVTDEPNAVDADGVCDLGDVMLSMLCGEDDKRKKWGKNWVVDESHYNQIMLTVTIVFAHFNIEIKSVKCPCK